MPKTKPKYSELEERIRRLERELERKEQALETERFRLREYFENLPLMAYNIDAEGFILDCNNLVLQALGYAGKDELIGKPLLTTIYHPDCRDKARRLFRQWKEKGEVINQELKVITKKGEPLDVLLNADTIYDSPGKALYSISTHLDITERKHAEESLKESEEKYRLISENIPVAVYSALPDKNSTDLFISGNIEELTGYPGKEFLQDPELWDRILHPEDRQIVWEKVLEHRRKRIPLETEYRIITRANDLRWIRDKATPLLDKQGRIRRINGFMEDITGRKQAEQQLQASLREKELMLQELYHRVKNNLQVVVSLLNLKSKNVRGKKAAAVLEDCKNFVGAMTSVHERLYRDKDLGKINFKEFITEIATELVHAFHPREPDKVALRFDLENVFLGIDSAIPCGLLLNELVTNSLRHAFPGDSKGEIAISLHRRKNNEIELSVSDNGIGLSGDLDYRNTKSFGLYLVSGLAEKQLQGRIESTGGRSGTGFRIVFQQDRPRKKGKG